MSAPQFRPVWTCFPITEVDEEAIRKNILRVWSNMHWTSVLPMMRQWKQTFLDTNKRRINWNTIMNITDVGEPLNDIPLTVGLGATSLIYKDTYDTIKGTSWVADDAILQALLVMIYIAPSRYKATVIHPLCQVQWFEKKHRRPEGGTYKNQEHLQHDLRYVDLVFVPVHLGNHWNIMVIVKELKRIIHFEPYLRKLGREEYAQPIKDFIKEVSDDDSGFEDIQKYTWIYAHDHFPRENLPYQRSDSTECGFYCIAFAANFMTDHHVKITKNETQQLRDCLLIVLARNTSYYEYLSENAREKLTRDQKLLENKHRKTTR